MKSVLIIGAGGVTSYLLPVLLKTFKPGALCLVDKDLLEERNLDRQMFRSDQVGQSKARALANLHFTDKQSSVHSWNIVEEWFEPSLWLGEDWHNPGDHFCPTAIFCCADNHQARYAAIQRAEDLDCYAYIGGNEYIDSQALVYHRRMKGTKADPLVRYPNIATDMTGSPFRCTGEAQETSPQLAMANMHCAAKLLHLAWTYERWLPEQQIPIEDRQGLLDCLPVEFHSSTTMNTSDSLASLTS